MDFDPKTPNPVLDMDPEEVDKLLVQFVATTIAANLLGTLLAYGFRAALGKFADYLDR